MDLSNLFLSLGNNITQANDPLQKINIYQLHSLLTSNEDLKQKSIPLKQLYLIDKSSYNQAKRKLPYVVPSIFSPPFRLKTNFGFSQLLILDIDHISQTNKTTSEIKQLIIKDPRVLLLFTSPSGDGLKVFFLLKERCSSDIIYSNFYKQFAQQFAAQYNLITSIDKSTSDVTRACFLSFDPHTYFNPQNVEPININIEPSIFTNNSSDNNNSTIPDQSDLPTPKNKQELPKEIYDEIRKTLNPQAFEKELKKQNNVIVTNELKTIEPLIHQKLQEIRHIQNFSIKRISYGLQININVHNTIGEINLYHGKKGFSIVLSTRTNTHSDTSLLLKHIVQQVIIDFFNKN